MIQAMQGVYKLHRLVYSDKHIDRLVDQGSEEAAELVVALMHFRRGRKSMQDVVGEFADLTLCIEFLREAMQIPDDVFKQMVSQRTGRLHGQLKGIQANRGHV